MTAAEREPTRTGRARVRALGVVGAVAAAVAVWGVAELGLGLELQVTPGIDEPQPVGVGSVAVASAVAASAGWGLLALLERYTSHGRALWLAIAVVVLVASMAGPLAGVTFRVTLTLASMHLAVAAVLVPVLHRTSPERARDQGDGSSSPPSPGDQQTPSPDGSPGRDNWWLVCTAGLLIYMAQLDTTIVHVALPVIETDLETRTTVTQWVVLGYLIPLVGLTLLSGRWLDTVGRRAALSAGAGGFAVASVVAGLASDISWLVSARVVQGVFAAVLLALAPVMAVRAVRPEARGRALAVVGALAPLGAMTGPVAGGFLLETLGWPWIFFVNVPVAAVAIAIGRVQLPVAGGLRLPQRRWMTEVVLLGGAAAAVLVALSLAADRHLAWLGLVVAAPPLLLAWQRSAVSEPVRNLLALPGMPGPHVAFLTSYVALLLVQFLAPFYLARVLDVSPLVTGTTLLVLPAATALAGPLSGVLSDRLGPRPIAAAGAGIGTVGLLLLLPLSPGWTPVDLAWRLGVLGAGFGLFVTPNMATAMSIAPTDRHGLVAATTNLTRLLGLSLGPAAATVAWALSGYTLAGMRAGMVIALLAGALTVAAVAITPAPSHHSQSTGAEIQQGAPTAPQAPDQPTTTEHAAPRRNE